MQSRGQTVGKVVGIVLVLVLLAGIVALIYRFTNGFNEDFKTFYVEYDGEQILSADSKMDFKAGETYRFSVKYTFDTANAEPKGYNVKVVPNVERDFDFTVDGKRYLYSREGDLTTAFGLNKLDTYFELVIPEDFDLQYVLQCCYPEQDVNVPEEAENGNAYPYMLVISSYNESVIYNIALSVAKEVTGVTLDPEQVIFTGN